MSPTERALGAGAWGRKAARLPDEGTLLVCTDLQGNRGDYEAMKALYKAEERAGNRPVLLFCGDMVHGPSPDLLEPGAWPEHLGTPYHDESREILLDFERFTREHRALGLMGNHEHAHVGGPRVPKFYPDEAAVLDHALGDERARMHAFLREWPLLAVARCGAVFTHGAPRATEDNLEAFESLTYDGFARSPLGQMYALGTVGALLWARAASPEQARALLAATALDGRPNAFVAYGHDVVTEGYEKIGDEQICVSTSFGLHDKEKVYLRLDLARRFYASVDDLREGVEILPLRHLRED